jgi:molybdopterin-guanine dinucleotide biosynthesis protein A
MRAAAILAGGAARRLGGAAKGLSARAIGASSIVSWSALGTVTPIIFIVAPDASPYREFGLRVGWNLCAIYANTCEAPIGGRIMRGELQASISEVGPEMLAAIDEDGRLLVNVNTPHDYARAAGLVELKPDPARDRITE